jgi:hypothetical protein
MRDGCTTVGTWHALVYEVEDTDRSPLEQISWCKVVLVPSRWTEDQFVVTTSSGIRDRDTRVAEIVTRELQKVKPGNTYRLVNFGLLISPLNSLTTSPLSRFLRKYPKSHPHGGGPVRDCPGRPLSLPPSTSQVSSGPSQGDT